MSYLSYSTTQVTLERTQAWVSPNLLLIALYHVCTPFDSLSDEGVGQVWLGY